MIKFETSAFPHLKAWGRSSCGLSHLRNTPWANGTDSPFLGCRKMLAGQYDFSIWSKFEGG